ncbi:MAG TPA: NIPSNAP family protein [Bryobacteraceae bacterium]|nr:NIPSNAP family protein [Bryobacteraceae bacterium]
MTRRRFVPSVAGAALTGSAVAAGAHNAVIELRRIELRNTIDNEKQRTSDFLQHSALPALQRASAGAIGFFTNNIAPEGPFLLTLVSYASLAAMEQSDAKLAADRQYQTELAAYDSGSALGYQRIHSRLLRAFGMPQVMPPPTAGRHGSRIFELRMYESNNATTLRRKIKMFNEGEMGIFKRLGMQPVFFGETIVGSNMPNLCYMLSYDDLAARERLWKLFGSDPEWQKLRSTPGYSDSEIVSKISNSILSPLPFSPIR